MHTNHDGVRVARADEHHDAVHAHRRRDMTAGLILIIVIGYFFLMVFVTFHRLITLFLPENQPPPSPIAPPLPLP
ncbi:hypothetical protein [Methylacidimicrobium sp. B4]|uniref:hypothetical protein n=1 Tax=Methylacidimicrobium sp. B4 TaxID=2796139 RepID=UPI001A8C6047|nr:hypothetical protein [Methylacidimicrobium sp. B4]QSR84258.1 hypothetical protein MacB4_08480 [Methylacidimicrobium sp. B4]